MNEQLDINTERGRIAAEDQFHAACIVLRGASEFCSTSDRGPANIDGIIVRESVIAAVVEIKTREATYEDLMGKWNGEWLLSFEKLRDIALASKLLAVEGFGFLYLPNSGVVLVERLTDSRGNILCAHRKERTETQATCNGGTALRLNAFIQMKNARVYRE